MDNEQENQDIIDVEYKEYKERLEKTLEEKNINGEPFYYNATQVSKLLNEKLSTIRYWVFALNSVLKIENSKFTKTDIENLLLVKKLKATGYTIKQIEEYCTENLMPPEELSLQDPKNPIGNKAFLQQFSIAMEKLNENIDYKLSLLDEKINILQELNNDIDEKIEKVIPELISQTIDDKINSIDSIKEDIISSINSDKKAKEEEIETILARHEAKITTDLRNMLEEQRQKQEELIKEQESKKKGFFKK